jgi:hypothetical protein
LGIGTAVLGQRMDLKADGVGEKGAAAAHEGYQDAYDSVQRLGAWRQVRCDV